MNTRKTKILKRSEEMEMDQENKRPRTPEFRPEILSMDDSRHNGDRAPSSTIEDILEESCFIPRTPEGPPPEDKDVEEAARTIINLQNSPAWCDPIRPLDILGGQYPDPIAMDFTITKTKRVNKDMDVYFIGIRHGFQARPWNYTIQSPPASAQFVTSKYQSIDYTRILISPSVLDGSFSAYPAEFMAFVDHVERLSDRLKSEMEKINANNEKWKLELPMKYSDNICIGLYAKVKNNAVREQIRINPNRLKCSLKLTCVYIGAEASGLTFELTQAYL